MTWHTGRRQYEKALNNHCCGKSERCTAKTTTVENLGIGLSRQNKKVLLIDTDPQASLTISLGYPRPDDLELTLSDLLNGTISENPVALDEVLIH